MRVGLWITALCWSLPLMAAGEDALRWRAPEGCPAQAEVAHALARVKGAARCSVDASVVREGAGYGLRLRVRGDGQSFQRELHADTCEVLAESAVFLVELAVSQLSAAGTRSTAREPRRNKNAERAPRSAEPGARGAESGARSAGADEPSARGVAEAAALDPAVREAEPSLPEDAREPELASTSAPETTHRAARTAAEGGDAESLPALSLRLGFGAAMVEAGLSGASPQLALDLSMGLAAWSLGVRLGTLLHPSLRVADGAEIALQTNSAQLLGCRYWDIASVLLGPCIALSALRTNAHSTGLTGHETGSANWLTAGPALSLQLRLMRAVLVGVEIGAWATLSPRPSFEVGSNTVARAGTLAGYARLGAAYELW